MQAGHKAEDEVKVFNDKIAELTITNVGTKDQE